MINHFSLAVAVSTMLVSGAANAGLVNAGFEAGNLTGWVSSSGNSTVVSSHSNSYGGAVTYNPIEGNFFLRIESGSGNVWQTVKQTFTIGAGQTIAGHAAFNWGDYPSYYDGARVNILDMSGAALATAFYADGNGMPSGFNGPWTAWSWTAANAGTYTLEYAARNTHDGGGPEQTYGYFDAAIEVPEPASVALLGLGLFGLAAARRKKVNA